MIQAIAAEERCSDRHVKNCAKLAAKVEEACACGLAFLKWPLLSERIRYSAKLIDELINLGGENNSS